MVPSDGTTVASAPAMTRRLSRSLHALLVVGLVLAGCGETTSAETPAPTTPAPTPPGSSPPAVTDAGSDATPAPMNGESIAPVASCTIPGLPTSDAINVATDVTYTTVGGQPLALDAAWPKTPGPHPMVVA